MVAYPATWDIYSLQILTFLLPYLTNFNTPFTGIECKFIALLAT